MKQGCWCGRKTFHRRAVGRGAHGPTGCSQWPTGHSGLLRLQQRRGQGSGQVVTADRDPRHNRNNHQHRDRWPRSRTGPGAHAERLCGEMLLQERLNTGFFNLTADKTRQESLPIQTPGPMADMPDYTLRKETQKSVSEKLSRGIGYGMAPVSRRGVR